MRRFELDDAAPPYATNNALVRAFHVQADQFTELPELPEQLPADGFLWLGCGRHAFEHGMDELQSLLQRWGCGQLVDLHLSDLLNDQLPSQYDSTSWYDLMVFRRLAKAPGGDDVALTVDTSPVGFAVFDRVLVTVHPLDCSVRERFAQRLTDMAGGRSTGDRRHDIRGMRLPPSPSDLMLRMVNHMVDSYLDLRRSLSRRLDHLQQHLLNPKGRFADWHAMLESRNALHALDDTCEDQRAAVQEWLDELDDRPPAEDAAAEREHELLRVRARDVLEHIERVVSHIHRLEQSADAAVQMHYAAQGQRTSDIILTLTVLTAVFLPLNLITGFFGMNFESLPLIHSATGVWIALGMMVAIAGGLGSFFWRRRYLGRSAR